MSPEDELSLRIGRVARAHVQLDQLLRQVFVTLASPGSAVFLANNNLSTGRLVEDIRVMIRKSELPEEFVEAANTALDAVKQANTVRNRIVHDMWLRDVGVDGQIDDTTAAHEAEWNRFRNVSGALGAEASDSAHLGELDAGLTQIQRSYVRIHALYFGLWDNLPFFRGSRDQLDVRRPRDWTRVMQDHFILQENGSYRAT